MFNVKELFLVMWYHWYWCYCDMMPTVLSMAPFLLLGQMIKRRCNMMFWSCDAMGISIMWNQWHQWHHCICLVKIIKMCNMTLLVMWSISCWHWHHVMLMALSMAQLYLVAQHDKNEVQHDFLVMRCQWQWSWLYMMPMTYKWYQCIPYNKTNQMRCNMTLWPFDTPGSGISITWCQQHCQWHQHIP